MDPQLRTLTGLLSKGIEVAANVAIIVVALLLGLVLVKNYLIAKLAAAAKGKVIIVPFPVHGIQK